MSFASDATGLAVDSAEAMDALVADLSSRWEALCEDGLADSPDAEDCAAAREFMAEAAARGEAEGYPVTVAYDDANVQGQIEISLGNLSEWEPDAASGLRPLG